jgi:hypothetical protein
MQLERDARFASARDFQKSLVEHLDRAELPPPAASRARPSQALEATVSGSTTAPLAAAAAAPSVAGTSSPPPWIRSPRRVGIGLALFGLLLAAGAAALFLLQPEPVVPEPEPIVEELAPEPPVSPEVVGGEEPPATVELDVPPVLPLPGEPEPAAMTEPPAPSEPPPRRITKRAIKRLLYRNR